MAYLITDDCIACGTCIDECPVAAISEGDIYKIESDSCTECGTCVDVCPTEAITINEVEDNNEESAHPKIEEEMIIYLTLDGKIKVIPVFKDVYGNIINHDKSYTKIEEESFSQEKLSEIYFINKQKMKYEEKAEELEYLISKDNIKESELQSFFERNPEFILDGYYCEAIPQVVLEDEKGNKSRPDFVLKPNERISVPAKIIELKLPSENVLTNYERGRMFSQKVIRAVGQLRKYYRYFMSKENQKNFFMKYRFHVFSPRLALIIGKDITDVDPQLLNDLKSTLEKIDIMTYNEVLSNYRQKIKHIFR